MLYNYEKKGFIVLMIMVVLLIILPRQLKKKNHDLFLLPDLTILEGEGDKKETGYEIDLNTVDSTTLTMIRGIGPVYASRIIHYRNLLGGYSDVNQLKEINLYYLNIDSILPYFYVDKNNIQRRNISNLTFKEVLAHPYLNYENVKSIFYIKNKFNDVNIELLRNHHVIPDSVLIKIEPYFQ